MNSLAFKRLLVLCLLSILAACGSSKKKDLKPTELESIAPTVDVKFQWERRIGSGLGKYYHQFAIAVDQHYIYAGAEDGVVYKLRKDNGKKVWRVSLKTDLTTGVSIDSLHVYVALLNGSLLALDKQTGQQKWVAKIGSEIVSPPSIDGANLVLQASNGKVVSLDTTSGEQRWSFNGTLPALTLRGTNRAVFFGGFVAIGQANGKLALLDANTGQLRWEPKIATPKGDTEIERIVDVDATPVVDKTKMYAVSYQGRLMALDLQSGRDLWAEDESSYRDLASGFGNIYVSSSESAVSAYDKSSGELKWVQEGLLRRKISAPTAISSYIAIGDYKGFVHLISQVDGEFAARLRVSAHGVKSNIVADRDYLYIIADNGLLKAFRLGDELEGKTKFYIDHVTKRCTRRPPKCR